MKAAGLSLAIVALALSGCSTVRDRVVLLPDATGKVGKVLVKSAEGEALLESAYSSAETRSGGTVAQRPLSQAEVAAEFGPLLASLPPKPVSYFLYFVDGSDRFTEESLSRIPTILADIASRPAPEVVVIGHTDTVGKLEDNDELSLLRAKAFRSQLLLKGFDAKQVSVAGRGERDLMVPTPDETPEPENRNAEINVR